MESVALKPSQREALTAILEDGLEQLQLLGSIAAKELNQKNSAKKSFEEEMTRFFDIHQNLFNKPTNNSGKTTANSHNGNGGIQEMFANSHLSASQSLLQSNGTQHTYIVI